MTRTSFVFYESFYEAMEALPNDEFVKVMNAICRYALYGELTELDGIAKSIFILIKPQLDANNRKYENGKKGGRPTKTETDTEPSDNLTETKQEPKGNQTLTETEPNVNVNVNDNVNANDNKSTTKVVGTPTKRISLKDQLVNYVNELEYSEETKQALFDWIFQIGLNGKVSVKQLQDKLDSIRKVYSDESLIRESIREAYRNNWFGFFPVKSKPTVSPAVLEKKEPSSFTNIPQDNSYNTNQQFQPQPYKKGGLNFIY